MADTRGGADEQVMKTPSPWEQIEMEKLGLLDSGGRLLPVPLEDAPRRGPASVQREAITNYDVLNEAHAYDVPSSFSRGLRVDLRSGSTFLWISGTASIDDTGETVYKGDFRAQCWRTYRNITELLRSEGATWQDIVRTTCYLRDIERDYQDFNEVRTHFMRAYNLDPLPASTGIQARLCREDLLVEIEAIAIVEKEPRKS
jgi:2-iminobutanoate/2-iminopropanoate deaminase